MFFHEPVESFSFVIEIFVPTPLGIVWWILSNKLLYIRTVFDPQIYNFSTTNNKKTFRLFSCVLNFSWEPKKKSSNPLWNTHVFSKKNFFTFNFSKQSQKKRWSDFYESGFMEFFSFFRALFFSNPSSSQVRNLLPMKLEKQKRKNHWLKTSLIK